VRPVLDRVAVRLYYPDSDRWGQSMLAGDAVALSSRPLADHHFVYPLELPAGERAVVYLQLQARETLALPLELIDEKQLIEGKLREVDRGNPFVARDKVSKSLIAKGYEPDLVWKKLKTILPE